MEKKERNYLGLYVNIPTNFLNQIGDNRKIKGYLKFFFADLEKIVKEVQDVDKVEKFRNDYKNLFIYKDIPLKQVKLHLKTSEMLEVNIYRLLLPLDKEKRTLSLKIFLENILSEEQKDKETVPEIEHPKKKKKKENKEEIIEETPLEINPDDFSGITSL